MLLSYGESLFTWSDETDVDFTNWDQDEPNGAVSKTKLYTLWQFAGSIQLPQPL